MSDAHAAEQVPSSCTPGPDSPVRFHDPPSTRNSASTARRYAQPPVQEEQSGEVDDGDAGGIIRCICGYDTDDGFTIQCERCLVWQHCACFGMSQASVPDEYLCEACAPRIVNVAFAQQHQAKRREAEARKLAVAETSATSVRGRKPSVSFETNLTGAGAETQPTLAPTHAKSGSSKRSKLKRKTPALVETPSSSTPRSGILPFSSVPASSTASITAPISTAAAATPTAAATVTVAAPTPTPAAVARAEAEERAAEKAEAWHAEFTPVARNLVAEPGVLVHLATAMHAYTTGDVEPLYAEPLRGSVASSRGVSVALRSQAQPNGLSVVGNECVPIAIRTNNLARLARPTYVKHISDAAAAGVFANVLSIVPLPSEPSRPWSASRTFSRPTMHGLFADAPISAGAFIAEYRGELSSSHAYRTTSFNQYAQLGTTKPHVHLFPPPLACVVDARRFGTQTRFARSSCHPNAVLRPILFSREEAGETGGGVTDEAAEVRGDEEQEEEQAFLSLGRAPTPRLGEVELRFGLFALQDIARTHEITLGWEWDDAHIVHLLPVLVKTPAVGLPPASIAEQTQAALTAAAQAKISASSSLSVARTTERERRTAALAALAERGDFPYANTHFGSRMNAVLSVLLGSTLCACIGSAAAPTAHAGAQGAATSASTNNARKQDCAVAQMLRLANGMAMLNVVMPGAKSARKVRAPDFRPLVSVRRGWRLVQVPSSPPTDEHAEQQERLRMRHLNLSYRLTPGGKVGRVTEHDFLRAVEEAKKRQEAALTLHQTTTPAAANKRARYTSDEEMDDVSVASSLTEPLSGLSDVQDVEMEEDLALLLRSNKPAGGAGACGAVEAEESEPEGSSILPFKKRVSGTRLKATYSGGEDSDAERAGAAGRRRKGSRALPLPRSQQKARAKAALASAAHAHVARSSRRSSSAAKRSHKRQALATTSSDDEEEEEEGSVEEKKRKQKPKRRTSKVAQPSSPLSSALSDDDEDEDSLSDAPEATVKRKNSKTSRKLEGSDEDESEDSDDDSQEASEESSDGAATLKSTGSKSRKSTSQQYKGTSESLLRKRNAEALAAAKLAKARKQRKLMSLAHLGDTESSGDEPRQRRPSASAPSASASTSTKRARSPAKQTRPGKSKKPRLIVSSDEESASDVDASPSTKHANDRTPLTSHESQWGNMSHRSPGQPWAHAEVSVVAQAPASVQAPSLPKQPTPPPAPKPEPPRAKLTLAEYKKRLAERRNNEASAAASETPSASMSATIDTPQSTGSALLEGLSPFKTELSRFAPPAPRPPRPLTPPRSFPPAPAPAPAAAAGIQLYGSAAVSAPASTYAVVPSMASYAAPQQAAGVPVHSSMYGSPAQMSGNAQPAMPRTPPFNAVPAPTTIASRPPHVPTPRPPPHQQQLLHHQQQQQQHPSAYGAPPPLELGVSLTGPSPPSWGVGSPSLETSVHHAQSPQVQQQQHVRPAFTPIRPGFRPITSARGGGNVGGVGVRPVAPAGFNPPRGPKALSNPVFAPPPPQATFAQPQPQQHSPVRPAQPVGASEMLSGGVRKHSGSFSNVSAASMSPPGALGFHASAAAHGRSHDVAAPLGTGAVPSPSPTLRPQLDFAGVPKGPRAPAEEVREPRAPLPPPREPSVGPADSTPGAGVSAFEHHHDVGGASPFAAGSAFRGRGGAWRPPGANTRGFVRGSGWGTRARGEHRRGGGRGRGRGGWQ